MGPCPCPTVQEGATWPGETHQNRARVSFRLCLIERQRLLSICTCFQVGAGLPLRCTSNGYAILPGNERCLHPALRGLLSDHGGAFRCFNNLSYPRLGSFGLEELLGGSPSLQTQLTVRRPAPSDSPTVQEGGVFGRPANLAFKAPAAQPTHKTLWHLLLGHNAMSNESGALTHILRRQSQEFS